MQGTIDGNVNIDSLAKGLLNEMDEDDITEEVPWVFGKQLIPKLSVSGSIPVSDARSRPVTRMTSNMNDKLESELLLKFIEICEKRKCVMDDQDRFVAELYFILVDISLVVQPIR